MDETEDPLIAALRNELDGDVELVETHISWVLLAGNRAYKLKKPVKLPFVDFSTLERRKHFCEEELRINRRTAPELYLGLLPIGGTRDAPQPGREPAIEYAVEMRRFPSDATLDAHLDAGDVAADAIAELADLVAEFHAREAPADGSTGVEDALENFDELESGPAAAEYGEALAEMRAWTERECERIGDVLDERRRGGLIKELHGDLHSRNLVVVDGRIVPFDALEFNPSLRTIDVMNEVGFLVMDLIAHGRADLGFVFLNRYLEHTGDYGGLRVLRFFLVYRALVRAKVSAIALAQHARDDAARAAMRRYLETAHELARPPRPLLAITHGLSGSGKTTVTTGLVPRLPAVRVRSDLERKRLHGLGPFDSSGSGVGRDLYGREATQKTYAALEGAAEDAIDGGFHVIADASFLSAARRSRFERLAERRGARFAILAVEASDDVLRERIRRRARRGGDPSEADEAVLDYQLERREPLTAREMQSRVRVDTERDVDYAAVAEALRTR